MARLRQGTLLCTRQLAAGALLSPLHALCCRILLRLHARSYGALPRPLICRCHAQVDVNGANASPIYSFLKASSGDHSDIEWNFACVPVSAIERSQSQCVCVEA